MTRVGRAAGAVLALAVVFLLAPSAGYHWLSGLPLASLPEYLGFIALLPVAVWPRLRRRWRTWVATMPRAWIRGGAVVLFVGLLMKAMLFVGGGHDGFEGCYRTIYRAQDHVDVVPDDRQHGPCALTWTNPLARFRASRIDRTIDFGPGDWNLSFVNDSRFDFYDSLDGAILRDRLPFFVNWRGVVSTLTPIAVKVTWVGEADVWLGQARIPLAASYGVSRSMTVDVPAGRHEIAVAFRFDDGARVGMAAVPGPGAMFRLRTGPDDRPLRAAAAPMGWRLAGHAVDAVGAAAAIVIVLFHLAVIGDRWRWLIAAGLAAGAVYGQVVEWNVQRFDLPITIALFMPGVLVLQRSRRRAGLLTAWWCVAALLLAHEAAAASALDAVLIRRGGDDFLTYESFARRILESWSLQGGEDVFYMQPAFRYLRVGERLLFGDGDVLVPAFARTAIVMSLLAMVWTFRASGVVNSAVSTAAVVLLLLLVNTTDIVSLVRRGLSEYPTWAAFPLAFVLLFRPGRSRPAPAALLLGLALVTRFNQAPGLLWIFAVRAWSAWRQGMRTILPAVAVLIVVTTLPAVHNVVYGGRLVWTTTSAAIPATLPLPPARYLDAWRDDGVRARVAEQFRSLVYAGRATRRPGRPWPVFRGLQLLWLAAAASLLATVSVRRIDGGMTVSLTRRPWSRTTLRRIPILLTPAVFLAPHLFYDTGVYYPRHIMIGHIAMAAVALYAAHPRPDGFRPEGRAEWESNVAAARLHEE